MRPMIVATLAAIALACGHECRGQNDWQYPDPYFGILEIEKSRSAPGAGRAATQVERPRAGDRPSTGRGVLRGPWGRRWARLRGPQPH